MLQPVFLVFGLSAPIEFLNQKSRIGMRLGFKRRLRPETSHLLLGLEPKLGPFPPAPGRPGSGSGRNLWVSGLSSTTRATDLKNLFNKYGKVRAP